VPETLTDAERTAWLVFARASGLRTEQLLALIARHGGAAAALEAGPRAWREAGVSEGASEALSAPDQAAIDADRAWLEANGRTLLTLGSPGWPPLLSELRDAPIALFVEGDPAALVASQLAIVGSRNPTVDGRETAEAFARALAGCGLTITSGLALGIDAAAHRGALAGGGRTIAVLGSGPDIVYPPSHAALAREITGRGAIVSELPPGTPPRREHFPRRNRVISGLSLGTLVVEASDRSGSLITARLATEQGREVFAIPGSIHNPLAHGCHRLIREGAKLVETAKDILEELGPLAGLAGAAADTAQPALLSAATDPPERDPEYDILLEALGFEPVSIDTLVRRSGLTIEAVSSMLLILELRGDVQTVPGGLFARRGPRNPYGST
jgi:DNA processing protein